MSDADYRLKTDLGTPLNLLETVEQIPVHIYTMNKQNPPVECIGLFAHEVQEACPELCNVEGEKDGDKMQTLEYGRITPLTLGAIQELLERVKVLESKVAILESQ